MGVKNVIEIAQSRTISEINLFLHFMKNFKMDTKTGRKTVIQERMPNDSVDTLGVKYFIEIALSHTVSEINSFLHFTLKFKMESKNCGKTIFDKHWQMTLQIAWG